MNTSDNEPANGQAAGTEESAYDDREGVAGEQADDTVIDDPDTPEHPDAQTVAESEAAYEAIQHDGGLTPIRKYDKPRSILIMVLVVAGIVGLGIYAVIWSDHLRQKNEKIELRETERRHVMAQWQQRNLEIKQRIYELSFPGEKMAPANNLYKPLSPTELARYESLRGQYGTQFEPNENEKALIAETTKLMEQFRPPTQPATKEAATKPP